MQSEVWALCCPTCKSVGFPKSVLPDRCTFCDGSEGGQGPSEGVPMVECEESKAERGGRHE